MSDNRTWFIGGPWDGQLRQAPCTGPVVFENDTDEPRGLYMPQRLAIRGQRDTVTIEVLVDESHSITARDILGAWRGVPDEMIREASLDGHHAR